MGKTLLVVIALICHSYSIRGQDADCPQKYSCYTKGSVLEVDCSNRQLLDFPTTLPDNVRVLNLSNNQIQKLRFGNFSVHLKDLAELDLSYNRIQTLKESDLGGISVLQKLNLSWNRITSYDNGPLRYLPDLKELDLSNNNISHLRPGLFDGLNALETLRLSTNPITGIEQETFLSLNSLTSLDLSNTSWGEWENVSFYGLYSLRSLNLQNNGISTITMVGDAFPDAGNITTIYLDYNDIHSVAAHSFRGLESLQVLHIGHNQIISLDPDAFDSIPKLRVLILDYNPLQSIKSPVFSQLSVLEFLSLSNLEDLKYLSKTSLQGLRNLTNLDIKQNEKLEFIHVDLFHDLKRLQFLNMSYNNISHLLSRTFRHQENLTLDITGNNLQCDCHVMWLAQKLHNPGSEHGNIHIRNYDSLYCFSHNSTYVPLYSITNQTVECQDALTDTVNTHRNYLLGSSITLVCPFTDFLQPKIIWVTPRNRNLTYHVSHPLSLLDYPTPEEVQDGGSYHFDHYWHDSSSYYPEVQDRNDRVVVLRDGSLYIDYFLRTDTGPYKCVVETQSNISTIEFVIKIDNGILVEVKIMSFLVGFGSAASFFMLNLIHVFITALARRCINQRRREAIAQFIDNFEKYRSSKLGSLKENYNAQVTRIRETYRSRMDKLSEGYSHQMMRIREGASQIKEGTSHRVDIIRDKYHFQQKRIRDYSSHQMSQLRETYNNQILRMRDYSSTQLAKIHKKYKLKQKHMKKVLETMNIDNCRTVLDTECTRAESTLFEGEDILPNTPEEVQSVSSEEYLTAASTNSSEHASQESLHTQHRVEPLSDQDGAIIINCADVLHEDQISLHSCDYQPNSDQEEQLWTTSNSASLIHERRLDQLTYIDMDVMEGEDEEGENGHGTYFESLQETDV